MGKPGSNFIFAAFVGGVALLSGATTFGAPPAFAGTILSPTAVINNTLGEANPFLDAGNMID